jgi:hypothetical protein
LAVASKEKRKKMKTSDLSASELWTVSLDYTESDNPVVSFIEPGVIHTALFPYSDDEHPIGELIMTVNDVTICIVAELTGRKEIPEITAAMVDAAETQKDYAGTLVGWLGTAKVLGEA